MPSTEDLPLIFLYTADRDAIEGTTRFQKLVFLGQQEGGLDERFSFKADRFGPYSGSLDSTIRRLVSEGYIDVREETVYGNTRYTFTLLPAGIRRVQHILNEDTKPVFDAIDAIKREYNDLPLKRLLRIVYTRYERYTTRSELSTDQLVDPDATEPPFEPLPEDEPMFTDTEMDLGTTFEPASSFVQADDSLVDEYLNLIKSIEGVSAVYLTELDDGTKELVTVIERQDFTLMDRLYSIEFELLDRPDADAFSFHVTVAHATGAVGDGAERVYSSG